MSRQIPIVSEEHLIACKAIFNQPKDWLDIESMLADAPAGLDADEARKWVSIIANADVAALLDGLLSGYGFGTDGEATWS